MGEETHGTMAMLENCTLTIWTGYSWLTVGQYASLLAASAEQVLWADATGLMSKVIVLSGG